MNNFLLAIRFLTSIPLKTEGPVNEERLSGAVIFFPLVGLVLGLILIGINLGLSYLAFNPLLISVILIIALVVLTAALHLDGLSDTFDAFCSGKSREDMLKIMRDPHAGTMGILSLLSVVLLKISIIFSLDAGIRNIALIFMCVLSRWSLTLPIYFLEYARSEGKAKLFFRRLSFRQFLFVTLATLLFAAGIWNWRGLFVFTSSLLFSCFFNGYVNRKIKGVTGDTLGAALELNEVLILAACLLISRA